MASNLLIRNGRIFDPLKKSFQEGDIACGRREDHPDRTLRGRWRLPQSPRCLRVHRHPRADRLICAHLLPRPPDQHSSGPVGPPRRNHDDGGLGRKR